MHATRQEEKVSVLTGPYTQREENQLASLHVSPHRHAWTTVVQADRNPALIALEKVSHAQQLSLSLWLRRGQSGRPQKHHLHTVLPVDPVESLFLLPFLHSPTSLFPSPCCVKRGRPVIDRRSDIISAADVPERFV